MLDKFKAQLKAKSKAARANLSQTRIDAIADRLHKKFPDLTEDAEHDEQIDLLMAPEDFKDFAAADDFQRRKEAKDKKDKEDKEKNNPTPDSKENEEVEDPTEPAWAKALRLQNKQLLEKVVTLEKKDQTQTIQQRLKESLKDIPGEFYDEWRLPEKEEDFEPFVERVKTKHASLFPVKEETPEIPLQRIQRHIPGTPAPGSAATGGKVVKEATKEELDAVVKGLF